MASKEYIRPPIKSEMGQMSEGAYRNIQILYSKINELLAMKNDLPSYADNAAAVSGGLATGDWYYDTTLTGVRIVT